MSRLITLTILAVLLSAPAYAYLDPGTGSILLQGLLAAVAAGSAAVAAFWSQIRLFFAQRRGSEPPADDGDHDSPPS